MLPSTDPHKNVRGTARFPQQQRKPKKTSSCRLFMYLNCMLCVIVVMVGINILYLTQHHTEKTGTTASVASSRIPPDNSQDEEREDNHKQELEFQSIANAKEQFSVAAAKRHNAQHAQEFAMAYHNPHEKQNNNDKSTDADSSALNAKRKKRKQQHDRKLRNEQQKEVMKNSVKDVPTMAPVPLPPVEHITLQMTPAEIAWIQRRNATYFDLFENESNGTHKRQVRHRWQQAHWHDQYHHKAIRPEDPEGPWLDFIIAGTFLFVIKLLFILFNFYFIFFFSFLLVFWWRVPSYCCMTIPFIFRTIPVHGPSTFLLVFDATSTLGECRRDKVRDPWNRTLRHHDHDDRNFPSLFPPSSAILPTVLMMFVCSSLDAYSIPTFNMERRSSLPFPFNRSVLFNCTY